MSRLKSVPLLVAMSIAGCAQPEPQALAPPPPPQASLAAVVPPAPPPLPAPVPFEEAVAKAASAVFSNPNVQNGGSVVIDPLIDGVTGSQTRATKSIQRQIESLVAQRFPQFRVEPLTPEAVKRSPFVLVGTFTPIDKNNKYVGQREAFRFCLVLLDLSSGKAVAKSVQRSEMNGVDATPLPAFADAPTWVQDKAIAAYIQACQGTKPGDAINPVYVDGLLASALIAEAIDDYNNGRYREALERYDAARYTNAGDQLRVWNGIYLTNVKLGNREMADQAFKNAVDYGLKNSRLGVKFLFGPGSPSFISSPVVNSEYNLWLRDIAQRAALNASCLEVTGHTSVTGPAGINDRLSQLRADYVKRRLTSEEPGLDKRLIANGVGSREPLVGTGTDDETDALDRRVEFKVIPACNT